MGMTVKISLPLALAASAALLSACATGPSYAPQVAVFDAAAFGWSSLAGANSIEGQVVYAGGTRRWSCTGSIGLTPETPWTRQRFLSLYGSTERAVVPAAVVRARTVTEASSDYRTFVRNTACDAQGRFVFTDLPDGAWFLIAPIQSDGVDPVVIMRRVETRGGRVTALTLD